MLNDLLKIVVDPKMPPQIEPDSFRENQFELIYQDASARHGSALNKRRKFTHNLLYPPGHINPTNPMDLASQSNDRMNQKFNINDSRLNWPP